MKDRIKATIAALATMAVVAAIFALPALASTGVDEAWTPEMNQTSYWEARFGGDCDKTENHSGYIPAGYTQAVVKDGTNVRVYEQPGPFTALGPVNNGKHHEAPHSWVMKCVNTTSTSSSSSTTSTSQATTTTLRTTTTQPETSTTVPDSTSTTVAESSTTSTAPATSSSTVESLVLPFTGALSTLWALLGFGMLSLGGLVLYLTKTQP